MITTPEVSTLPYPAGNVTQITWDCELKGERCPLSSCSIRLGTGKDTKEVTWIRRLDVRGDYANGHVEECLEKEDIPKSKTGQNIYVQFMFVAKNIYDEHEKKIIKNNEGEVGLSKIVRLVS